MIVISQRLGEATVSSSTDCTMPVNIRIWDPIVPEIDARLRSRSACLARSALLLSVTRTGSR
jgi:hypothetical protein